MDPDEKEDAKSCAEFLSLSQASIEEYEEELEKMKNVIPFDHMTTEDLHEASPETKLDKKNMSLLASQTKWEFINLSWGESSGPYIINSGH